MLGTQVHTVYQGWGTTLSGELQATNFLGTTQSGSGNTELVQWYPVVDR